MNNNKMSYLATPIKETIMKMTWLILVIFELMLSFSANCSAEALKAEQQPAHVYQVASTDAEMQSEGGEQSTEVNDNPDIEGFPVPGIDDGKRGGDHPL